MLKNIISGKYHPFLNWLIFLIAHPVIFIFLLLIVPTSYNGIELFFASVLALFVIDALYIYTTHLVLRRYERFLHRGLIILTAYGTVIAIGYNCISLGIAGVAGAGA
jgi:hypothetical protein